MSSSDNLRSQKQRLRLENETNREGVTFGKSEWVTNSKSKENKGGKSQLFFSFFLFSDCMAG